MSNWLDYVLDVLASDPQEITAVAKRLTQPSEELVNWVSFQLGIPPNEGVECLKELLDFKTVTNLGCGDPSVNKALGFSITFKDKFSDIVGNHLAKVSEAFPKAIFLLEYRDMQYSYSGKEVIRAAEKIQSIHDGNQRAQCVDWALLDIFAPFRAEYEAGLPFGSLWGQWLEDMETWKLQWTD